MPTYSPDEFADVLLRAATRTVPRETQKVVRRGLLNVKKDARRNSIASSGRSAALAPRTIGYDEVHADGLTIWGAVEYLGGGQAKLGVLLEFGGGRDHSPPHHDLRRALDAEEPRFVHALADTGEQAIE
jgi:hypothetical protein